MVDIEDVGCLTRLSRIAELLTLLIGVAALCTAIGAAGGGLLVVSAGSYRRSMEDLAKGNRILASWVSDSGRATFQGRMAFGST